jgi:hypothetical protein
MEKCLLLSPYELGGFYMGTFLLLISSGALVSQALTLDALGQTR